MKRLVLGLTLFFVAALAQADVVIFKDGSRMEVTSFQVKGRLLLIQTSDGKLRSVPVSLVDLDATRRRNRPEQPPPTEPEPASEEPEPASEEPEPVPEEPEPVPEEPEFVPEEPEPSEPVSVEAAPLPDPEQEAEPELIPEASPEPEQPELASPDAAAMRSPETSPDPRVSERPDMGTDEEPAESPDSDRFAPSSPSPDTFAPPRGPGEASSFQGWTDEELRVALPIPSPAWSVDAGPPSFDVAVTLKRESPRARATLGLVRREIRDYRDFQEILRGIEASVAVSPGYQLERSQGSTVGAYRVHELRFLKTVDSVSIYTRMVIYYSRDMAYVLSLSCPEESLPSNQIDFDQMVRGLRIEKTVDELTPRGAPRT